MKKVKKKRSPVKSKSSYIFQIVFFLLTIASIAIAKAPLIKKQENYIEKFEPAKTSNVKENSITTCFTPHQRCLSLIIKEIEKAKDCIYLQGYSFTSLDIAQALVRAHKRGVKVMVLLDKSQKKDKRSQTSLIKSNKIMLRIDSKPAIAHNKIILIDHKVTITGSYNWTKGAEYRNAENLLIINEKSITKIYESNFKRRWNESFEIEKSINQFIF